MSGINPRLRMDLEFFPVQHEGRQMVLIRDQLGLVREGKAVDTGLYQFGWKRSKVCLAERFCLNSPDTAPISEFAVYTLFFGCFIIIVILFTLA